MVVGGAAISPKRSARLLGSVLGPDILYVRACVCACVKVDVEANWSVRKLMERSSCEMSCEALGVVRRVIKRGRKKNLTNGFCLETT